MKGKVFAAIAALALVSLACGRTGNTASTGAGCPTGWNPVQSGGIYHGVILGIASDGGGFSAFNTVEGASISSGFSVPGSNMSMYTVDGWMKATWDGQSNYVCARWEPDHVVVTPGPSTGSAYILDGDGCPDGYTFVRDGGDYGGCTFETGDPHLKVYCNGEFNRNITTYESGPVWRSDDEPSERGLQVFWPGGAFACVRER